jgi:N-acetylmuramoyl-L-alanine amidase
MTVTILRRGDQGPAVTEVRDRLVRLGLLSPDASAAADVFDDILLAALRYFQQTRGLTVDGLVGPQTFRRLDEARWKIGDRVLSFTPGHVIHGEDVAQLQQRLIELGFALDRVDGIFAKSTDSAVREFQRNVGLDVDGICGPAFFRAFQRLARTIAGGSQEHLRELSTVANFGKTRTVETCSILLDPSDLDEKLVGSEYSHSDICWDIASRLEGRLGAMGTLVLLTRPQGGKVDGERTRASLANDSNVDLIIGLGLDRHSNPLAQGVASYYFGHEYSRSATGMRLAEIVQEEISSRTSLADSKSHAKTWDLLRLTRMPSIKVEMGYATSPHDSALLSQAETRDQIAAGLSSAVTRILAPRIG